MELEQIVETIERPCNIPITRDRGNYITTFSGGKFWPLDPHADEVLIADIAHAESNICRFNGHSKQHYSVAQHSLVISYLLEHVGLGLAGLLDDAPEVYLCDIPSPMKVLPFMDEMRMHQDKIGQVICHKFNISLTEDQHKLIKIADISAFCAEASLMMNSYWRVKLNVQPEYYRKAMRFTARMMNNDISTVYKEFLFRFGELGGTP